MYSMMRRALFRLDAERAHRLVIRGLATWPTATRLAVRPVTPAPSLAQSVGGIHFAHPLGLAAGLDKNGVALPAWAACGFAFAEIGTVTPQPQPGNLPPRLFRLAQDDALINRMGFNSRGAQAMQRQLQRVIDQRLPHPRIGINLGRNKSTPNDAAVDDYLTLVEQLGPFADYITLNVSSPNTPGLRDLQTADALVPLVVRIIERRNELATRTHRPGVFVKLAPDLADDALRALAVSLANAGIDGLCATNTTLRRDGLTSAHAAEAGGLSGKPLRQRATDVIRLLWQATGGALPIIGSGGVFTAVDAYEKIRAGASLIQLYTGFIYRGPAIVADVVTGLADLLDRDGYTHIAQAVGQDA